MEGAMKQGKITISEVFSADLSTETVDAFGLALPCQPLQRMPKNHISCV